jgi:branched-chain amino acid transport system permease protein
VPDAARRAAAGVAAALGVVGLWAVLDNTLERGLPLGIVGLGAVSGLLYAVNAIGLVLIFRANRVINFAQAEFGSVAAVLAIQLSIHWHVPFFVSVAIALVCAAILGAVVEGIVLRRFARASRLILAVATIALAQILAGLSLIIPLLWSEAGDGEFAVPFTAELTIFPVTFDASHVLIALTVPALVVALGVFLLKTDYGIAIRGAAENADRAGLLGVPVPRLATIVWVTAAVLSALAVVFRTTLVGYSAVGASGAGNSLLLFTLAAAVVGRMEHLPRTVAAAVFLGIFQEAAIWTWSNTTIVDGLLLVVILVGLLLQRHAFSRASDTGIQTWRAVRDVRPVPAELRRVPEVRFGFLGLKLVLLGLAIALPLFASPSQSGAAALVLIYAVVAISLFVLTGWGGHISLGQFALAGFGGATTAVLYGPRHGWDPLLAILAGVVVAGLVSLVLGLPALRIKGLFLAVTTLAFAVTSATFFLQERYVPWFIERRIERPTLFGRIPLETDRQMYWFALAVLLLVIFGVQGLRASRTGRALIATRDNEQAAQAVTIPTMRVKLTGFVISGALAGLAGGVYVLHQRGLHSDAFGAEVSLRLFSMVVIGGLGSLPGAVLGAIYVRGAEFFLRSSWALVASGGGILVLLLFLPEGLGGLVYSQRDRYLRWVAKRRGIHVPSLVADRRVDGDGAGTGADELELPDHATELEAALR